VASEEKKAVEIFVSGRVQGVNYRVFTEQEANLLGLTGYVRNLPDGRVQVEAEGDPKSLEVLIGRLRKGPRHASVADVQISFGQAQGKFSSFRILY
jgi:acylphosphatase